MTEPGTPLPADDEELLLNAYLDGELDAAAVLSMDRRLSGDARLRANYERLSALKGAVAAGVPRETASQSLRNKIALIAATPVVPLRPAGRLFDWRQMAASVLVAGVLASGATTLLVQPASDLSAMGSLVAEHRRALLAPSPVDIESTDRHTVKPWFDAKLALSPQVIDLTSAGYPLAGGRIEVAGGKLVPAMIYRRREHIISLVAVPRAAGREEGGAPSHATADGFTVLGWRGQDFDYYAVSDIEPGDLASFVSQWRAAAAAAK